MLDFHDAFVEYDSKIKLTEARKEKIRISREAIKDKIIDYHEKELNIRAPEFEIQGSFTINTALNPIDNEEVDMDCGVYLQDQTEDESEWLKPRDAHKRIIDALEGHTKDECISKTSCVRVRYRNFYHLDLPIYIEKDDKTYLARTSDNEWSHSDAREFRDWFYKNRQSDDVNKIVRIIKGWRDYSKSGFSSIELTILVVRCFSTFERRLDLIFYNTVNNIYNYLSMNRSINKPVAPYENLWEGYTENDIDTLINRVKDLKDDLDLAIYTSKSYEKGSTILIEVFGDRFPLIQDPEPIKHSVDTGFRLWVTV